MQSYYKKSFNSMIPKPTAHGSVQRITGGRKQKQNQKTKYEQKLTLKMFC